jgi:hypothetical protein
MNMEFGVNNEAGQLNSGLSDLELRILDFERQWFRYSGAKESSIRELFDLTPPRYYEVLNALIDREAALLAQPMLIKRLRRLRDARTEERSAARLGLYK